MTNQYIITAREEAEINEANSYGRIPVVFVHGLWLHASSWKRWAEYFRAAGFAPLTPGWPGDPESVEAARLDPGVVAGQGVQETTDHFTAVISQLKRQPLIIGHSLGGLIAQKLLGIGWGQAAVAIDPAPFRGVLPLPISSIRAALPVLGNPGNRKRAVVLTPAQFRYAFTSELSQQEAAELYRTFAIPAPGRPVFEAATANLFPGTAASVNTRNNSRGPLLIIAGEKDHTVPVAIVRAEYRQYRTSRAITEYRQFPGRGHSLTIDSGWREIATYVLEWFNQRRGEKAAA